MYLKKELPIILIVLIPFIYLAFIWNVLPEQVPIHWNANGEIDGWGSKATLLIIPFILPVLIYVILSLVPKIDPKQKIEATSKKFYNIKLLLTLFMSILALFILYSSKSQSFTNPNIIIMLIGLLYVILGNYMKTIKTNYFIGIRTPWTLENDIVWKKTHKLAGKYWFIGVLLVILLGFILEPKPNMVSFIIITTIITIIPVVYSYVIFKQLKTN
ncbi:putative membrane protein [Lacinutrix venerupis]|uniref:SdpI family protein n=1 Tax=Lacinutrix venerupis TaxID=1486034 RepID=UPI000EAF13F9|nr:SdpI family protein [Lacinutrix venerupis]RLJ62034.1 putative membrane protein [Lacinutrix venerupis]